MGTLARNRLNKSLILLFMVSYGYNKIIISQEPNKIVLESQYYMQKLPSRNALLKNRSEYSQGNLHDGVIFQ